MKKDNLSLIYKFHLESRGKKEITREEIKDRLNTGEEIGACDAFIFVSIIRNGFEPYEGEKSFAFTSRDGFKDELNAKIPSIEYFQVLTALADVLITDETIPDWQRHICRRIMRDTRINLGLDLSKFNQRMRYEKDQN